MTGMVVAAVTVGLSGVQLWAMGGPPLGPLDSRSLPPPRVWAEPTETGSGALRPHHH